MGKSAKTIFAANVRALRDLRHWTLERAAGAYGVSIRQVVKYERAIDWPSADILCRIADTYGVTVDQLLGRAPILPDRGEQGITVVPLKTTQ